MIASKLITSPPFVPSVKSGLRVFNKKQDQYLRNSSRMRTSLDPLCIVIDRFNSSIRRRSNERPNLPTNMSFFKHSDSFLFSPNQKDMQTPDLGSSSQIRTLQPIGDMVDSADMRARLNKSNELSSRSSKKYFKRSQ